MNATDIHTQVSSEGIASIDYAAWRERIRIETFANYHCEMGLAIQRAGDLAAAVAAFDRAIEIDPLMPRAYFGLVQCLRAMGRSDEAEAVHRRAVQADAAYYVKVCDAEADEHISNLRVDEAMDVYRRLLAHDPASTSIVAARFGALARRIDNWGESTHAEHRAREALKLVGHPNLHGLLAFLCLRNGRPAEAEDWARLSIGAGTNEPDADYTLGTIYQWFGRYGEAIEHFRAAGTKNTGQIVALFIPLHTGVSMIAAGRFAEAADALEQAHALQPAYGLAWAWKAWALFLKGHADEAEGLAREALALSPDEGVCHSILGLILQRRGRIADALHHQRQAAALRCNDAWCLSNLALAEQESGNHGPAVRVQARAKLITPPRHRLLDDMRPWAADALRALNG
ncbi:tetratricopeptide repeat protein [Azospirillum tabaci]|uniref:tetratricopeptide repeat protein n=1 Tax=Azospirillum tabaci TaxID=2752310 RepID=UPI001660E63C|nr:tetratricopeptide repeat protein [Azospirillum tabaci]